MNPQFTAFVFPGQGSQALGMGKELSQQYRTARQTFAEAEALLGFPISTLAWEGPEEDLNDTLNTQPALLVHSVAAWRVFKELYPGFEPGFVAGHSMGELSALVASGALTFEHALLLARKRGEVMKEAGERNPGGMAAILGLDIPVMENLCAEASNKEETVQVANDNSPGQVVISGSGPALDRAVAAAQKAGARKAVRLAVSIAAHSPLMLHAQEAFSIAVEASPITDPSVPLVGNVTARSLPRAADIRQDLRGQLTNRVRWTETIQHMAGQGVVHILEFGSGSVLTGLLKRIDRSLVGLNFGTPADLEKLAQAMG